MQLDGCVFRRAGYPATRRLHMADSTDRIERQIVINAPRSRVWRALADAEEFGSWFGVALEGQAFVAGQRTQGRITHPGYEHLTLEVQVERVEPERVLA